MSNPFIPNLANKSTPVAADLLIIADSQNSNNEKNTQIGQVITNNNLVANSGTITTGHMPAFGASNTLTDSGVVASQVVSVTGTYTSGDLPILGGSNQIKDSGISVDTSQNLTNVGNINGIAITNLLVKSNNLSDVTSASTSRTNLGLGNSAVKGVSDNTKANVASVSGSFTTGHILTSADSSGTIQDGGATSQFLLAANNLSDVSTRQTALNNLMGSSVKGDIGYFDGTNWVHLGIAATGNILTVTAGGVPGWESGGAVSGFVDNAVFYGNAGQVILSTPGSVNLSAIDSSTSGNTWTTNGDSVGMKCGQAGTYSFTGITPIQETSSNNGGVVWTQFYKNGSAIGRQSFLNMNYTFIGSGSSGPVDQITTTVYITCAVNDVITLRVASGASGYVVPDVNVTGMNCTAVVSIVRLI